MTQSMAYSANETCNVGHDTGSPCSPDHGPNDNEFTSEIDCFLMEIGNDNQDQLINQQHQLQVTLAKQ
ncbi:hypothetical protein [Mycobacterium leprae]|uniref:hypothetical protein n=1 Tax=Mycobacterium leprae TaxID=1769 RepID=UPI0003058B12|nr:hypothetical protein [Mycobacterium leprae]OAR21791.1 hypothetical protein A8144_00975 [Mycobacterium leprae 3125609]OAX72333.1 hypothetical protein A3216_01055 [Mycobacterium leprae 7935681]